MNDTTRVRRAWGELFGSLAEPPHWAPSVNPRDIAGIAQLLSRLGHAAAAGDLERLARMAQDERDRASFDKEWAELEVGT